MMNLYTSNTSEIIRNDFLRFSGSTRKTSARKQMALDADAGVEATTAPSLDDLRAEMAEDDGQGSFASYKSSIF
jgi:hypothetical protein